MNGLPRAVYHHSRVKLGLKGSGSPNVVGLDQARWSAAEIHNGLNNFYRVFSALEKQRCNVATLEVRL